MAEIRAKGDNITKSLRKVTDDEKLYKQKRDVQPVSFDELDKRKAEIEEKRRQKEATDAAAHQSAKASEPEFRLQDGKKWIIRNQSKATLTIDNPQLRQVVFISHCDELQLTVAGKLNSVCIVESRSVAVQLESVVSGVEVTKSSKVDIGVKKALPSAMLDNSQSVNLFLTDLESSRQTQIVTACCSSVNINVPDKNDNSDLIELAVPEQYVSRIVRKPNGGWKAETKPSDV
jgi:adenylyl cyclase-associated protein